MFEYILEEENKKVSLTDEFEDEICHDVGDMYASWDDIRTKQKNIANKLHSEIYLDERGHGYSEKEDEWKSDIHLNKIYSLFQTQQAYIWDNIYSDVENLFDVEGTDPDSSQKAVMQKHKLVNTLHKIGIQRKLDTAIEYLGSVGEICMFVSWKKKYKQIRRLIENADTSLGFPLSKHGIFGIYNQEIYNGANVEAINPLNLVFDPKVNPEDTEKWDSCGKIIKSWETYASIKANKLYHLKPEALEEIRAMLNHNSYGKNDLDSLKADDVLDDDRIEVLQYWGDYKLNDGTILKNWHIVVIGRKYLACFEENRWVINPIINVALFRDVESNRGIPELWSIYDLCKEQENKVNLQNDAQALNLNPPAYAPEGFFKEKSIKLFPGKQVEYKQGLEDPTAIIKMNFPLIKNEDIIQYYDSTASNVCGIFPNMQGQQEFRNVTATEINVKVQGQTTRLSKILDTIKQNLIVPMIEKIAELEANMKVGAEQIYLSLDGAKQLLNIDDEVRQGHYEYKYTDNAGIQKKMMLNQSLTQILTPIWNDPSVSLNKIEIIRQALNNIGIENTEKYINPSPTDPQSSQMQLLPQQAQVMQNLTLGQPINSM